MPRRPFSDLKHHVHPLGDVVRDQGRHADPEVHVVAVAELLRGPLSDLFAGQGHFFSSFFLGAARPLTAPSGGW